MKNAPRFTPHCIAIAALVTGLSFGSATAQEVPSGSDGYGHRLLTGTPAENNGRSNASLMVSDGIARTLVGPPIDLTDGADPQEVFLIAAVKAIFDQINLTLQSLINQIRIRDGLPPINFPNAEFDEPIDPADPVDEEETPAKQVVAAKAAARAGRINRESFVAEMIARTQR
jgi:hypothetical protein